MLRYEAVRRFARGILGVFVCAAVAACSATDCNDMSCVDELVVEVQPASGAFQPGTYTLNLTADGKVFTCTVAATGDAPGVGECTPSDATLSGSLRCEGDGCRPESMQTTQVMQLAIPGNPRSVTVRVERDGALLAEPTFSPRYEACGCEPSGRFGSVRVSVN
jgi:hypothetical protein